MDRILEQTPILGKTTGKACAIENIGRVRLRGGLLLRQIRALFAQAFRGPQPDQSPADPIHQCGLGVSDGFGRINDCRRDAGCNSTRFRM
jgi:hypothetical protein